MIRRLSMPLLSGALLLSAALRAELAGPPLPGNDYKVDPSPVVALGSARKVALGGAYAAVAEGVESLWENPAGVANRTEDDVRGWDWDASLGNVVVQGDDLDNNGSLSTAYRNHRISMAGLLLRRGRVGAGVYMVSQNFLVNSPDANHRFNFLQSKAAAGWMSPGRVWVLGLALRPVGLEVTPDGHSGQKLLRLNGTGAEIGVLWKPRGSGWTVGASYAGAVATDQPLNAAPGSTVTVAGLVVPREVTVPPVVTLGTARAWKNAPFLGGRPLLLSADLRLLFGNDGDTVGVESFLEQKTHRVGRRSVLSVHAGAEAGVLPGRLRLRAGGYHEPSRFAGVSARSHATGGFQWRFGTLRLFGERGLSLSYAFDVAHNYAYQSISLGFWR